MAASLDIGKFAGVNVLDTCVEHDAQSGLAFGMNGEPMHSASRNAVDAIRETGAQHDDVAQCDGRLVRDGDDRSTRTARHGRHRCNED